MGNAKTILLWGQNDLLSSAVEYLLKTTKGWEVVCVSHENNLEELIEQVKFIHPDLIIINHTESVADAQKLVHSLQALPEIKIVTINFENNSMEVFSKQTEKITDTSDFLSFLEHDCAES